MAVADALAGGGALSVVALVLASTLVLVLSLSLLLLRRSGKLGSGKVKGLKPVQDTQAADEPDAPSKHVTIFFGTQTGTAEGFSKVLAEEVRGRYGKHVAARVEDLDEYAQEDEEYQQKLSEETLAIFLLATYGDGEPTDNAARFCKWLTASCKDPDAPGMGSLTYAIFGLGNRQYEHFNVVGTTVDQQLLKRGAQRLVPIGLGDDDQCIEDDFSQWREALWVQLDVLLSEAGQQLGAGPEYVAPVAEYRVLLEPPGMRHNLILSPHTANLRAKAGHKGGADPTLFRAPVMLRRELHTPKSDRSAVHIELSLRGAPFSYCPGDHVGLFPQNSAEDVATAARCLGLDPEMVFSLAVEENENQDGGDSSLPEPFPGPCTLATALACYADLLNSPKKSALLALAAHASDQGEAERLRYLASPAGKEDYASWVTEGHRSLLEVMEAFPSARAPLGVFFAAVAPRLQPRFYSISSAASAVGESVHVTCAVVEERTPGGRLHRGVCSTWLQRCQPAGNPAVTSSAVPLYIRPSSFRMPANPAKPLVMVGPGTGLAPFRGFLQERSVLARKGTKLGPAVLFFGCRSREKDYIYQEELESFREGGVLTQLHVAFSRDGPQKDYVQHHMLAQAVELWRMIGGEGGFFYVCGDAKAMAKDVHRVLHTIIQQQECVRASEAEAIVKKLQTEGRYLRDIW